MPLSPDVKAKIIDKWPLPGNTARSIADELGVPYHAVRYVVRLAQADDVAEKRTYWGDRLKKYYADNPDARQQASLRAARRWQDSAQARELRAAMKQGHARKRQKEPA